MTDAPSSNARRRPASRRPNHHLRAVADNAAALGAEIRFRQRELFADALRAEPSKRGTPYSEFTIRAYLDAVDSLARWLTEIDHPDGFEAVTVEINNAYLSARTITRWS